MNKFWQTFVEFETVQNLYQHMLPSILSCQIIIWEQVLIFCGLKYSKSDCFLCQNTEVKFLVPMHRSYANTNVVLSISDFHLKYKEVKSPRRSGWISKILPNKKLKSNLSSYQVYVHINNQKLILPSIYILNIWKVTITYLPRVF